MTRPAKTDASILVGGSESSAGRRLMQYVPVRWSHKHCNCSRLPLAGQHRRGIMWTSTSWYHGLLILLRDFICCCVWNLDMETQIEEPTCGRSPRMHRRRLLYHTLSGRKTWVEALISVEGVICCCWGQEGMWMRLQRHSWCFQFLLL